MEGAHAMRPFVAYPTPTLLRGVGFFRVVKIAGGTPAFPAQRVLEARASRSHGSRNALLGNSTGRRACKNLPL